MIEVTWGHGLCDMETLSIVASKAHQSLQRMGVLDTFRDDLEVHGIGQGENRPDDLLVCAALMEVHDEALVDL